MRKQTLPAHKIEEGTTLPVPVAGEVLAATRISKYFVKKWHLWSRVRGKKKSAENTRVCVMRENGKVLSSSGEPICLG